MLARHNEISTLDVKKLEGQVPTATILDVYPRLQPCVTETATMCNRVHQRMQSPCITRRHPTPAQEVNDGERLVLPAKELDVCEIYPQNLLHNSNGRFAVVTGDGEYILIEP